MLPKEERSRLGCAMLNILSLLNKMVKLGPKYITNALFVRFRDDDSKKK